MLVQLRRGRQLCDGGGTMKRFLGAVMALAIAGIQPAVAQVQGQWTSTGAMQSPREAHAQVPLAAGKVLSIGGFDNSGNVLATAEVYSPTTSSWNLTQGMAMARQDFPAVVLKGGKILVSGGRGTGGTVLGAAEIYNPTTGTWSSAGTMSVARFGHTATLLKTGKVLVTGGGTGSSTVTPTSEYS
jgi:N-acetylneuraminic acid mutarotase